MTEKKNWNDLSVANQITFINQLDDDMLSQNYDLSKDIFEDFGRRKLKNGKLPKVELDEKSQNLLQNLLKDVK